MYQVARKIRDDISDFSRAWCMFPAHILSVSAGAISAGVWRGRPTWAGCLAARTRGRIGDSKFKIQAGGMRGQVQRQNEGIPATRGMLSARIPTEAVRRLQERGILEGLMGALLRRIRSTSTSAS